MDDLWIQYETENSKVIKEEKYKDLGRFHFLGKIFGIEKNIKLLEGEIKNNKIKIEGIETFDSGRICKKCGSKSIVSSNLQYRSADEGMAVKYTCLKCSDVVIEK